jgi:hypothetical protein
VAGGFARSFNVHPFGRRPIQAIFARCAFSFSTYNFLAPDFLTPRTHEVPVNSRICWFTLLLSLFLSPGLAQNPAHPSVPGEGNPPMTDGDEARSRIEHDMEKRAAKERVAALKSDTDKLLKLSVELKAYVDKSDENVLSLDVIKKADEIERLARSVKDKMKGPN